MEEDRIKRNIEKIKTFYFKTFNCEKYVLYATADSNDCCLVSLYGSQQKSENPKDFEILGNWFYRENIDYVISIFKKDETLADMIFEK